MPSHTYLLYERALLASLGATVLLRTSQPYTVLLDVVVAAFLTLHHWRQELLFAYIAIAAHFFLCYALPPQQWLHWVAVAAFVLGVAAYIIFPLPDFTRLHGCFRTIGCHTVRLGGVDCRVFYPSSEDECRVDAKKRVHYVHHGKFLAKGMSIVCKVPEWFFKTMDSAFLAALNDAPVATPSGGTNSSTGGWPLVIFSHGYGGSLEIYTSIVQEIASHGHVVVIVNHGDGSASVTRREDGTMMLKHNASSVLTQNKDGSSTQVHRTQLNQRVSEVRRVLHQLTTVKSTDETQLSAIAATVDFSNIHITGHSFGAATAIATAHIDERFRSAVLLDGVMSPVSKDVQAGIGSRIPIFHLISEQYLKHRQENVEKIRDHVRGCTHEKSELLVLRGSHHNNFTDLPLFSPIVTRLLHAAGSIEPQYANRAIAQLSVAFLNGELHAKTASFPEAVPVKR